MEIKINDVIRTPRFLSVRISEVFNNGYQAAGQEYTEPTHYESDDWEIKGKVIGINRMVFAAYKKQTCNNCKHQGKPYLETVKNGPSRAGFNCAVHGLRITRIGSDRTTPHICGAYEYYDKQATNLTEIGF